MNVRSKLILSGLALLTAIPAFAQRRPEAVPTMTVMTFSSQEPELGAKVADWIRERLTRSYTERTLSVVPTQRVVYILEESGYAPEAALSKSDEIQLGALLKVNEFITGSIDRNGDKEPYIVKANLVVLRAKEAIVQPLPVIEEAKVGRAMDRLRDVIKEARKQNEGERVCIGRAISGRAESDPVKRAEFFAQAIQAAKEGIAEYPQATIARTCIANVYYSLIGFSKNEADSMAYMDSSLAAAAEIIAIDSFSLPALRISAELNRIKRNETEARRALLGLVRADPTNTGLVEQVVNELAASGNSKDAVPLVRDMLEQSPSDAKVLKTAFLVFSLADQHQDVIDVGPELIKADTAAADSSYFERVAQAYLGLQKPELAASTYAAGSARFPKNRNLMLYHYASLKQANKESEAVDVLARLVNLDLSQGQPLLLLVNHYLNSTQIDSAISLIQRAEPYVKDDSLKINLGFTVLKQANIQLRAAQADSSDTLARSKSISLATLADKLNPSPPTKYVLGSVHLLAAQYDARAAVSANSCTLAQSAKQAFASSKAAFDAIRTDQTLGEALKTMQPNIDQLEKAIEYQTTTFCK